MEAQDNNSGTENPNNTSSQIPQNKVEGTQYVGSEHYESQLHHQDQTDTAAQVPPSQASHHYGSPPDEPKKSREKAFIPVLLLISAAVIALIIGVGWALFYPRQATLTDKQKDDISLSIKDKEQARAPTQSQLDSITDSLISPEGAKPSPQSEETEIIYGKIKQDPTRINQISTAQSDSFKTPSQKPSSSSDSNSSQKNVRSTQKSTPSSTQAKSTRSSTQAESTPNNQTTKPSDTTYWIQVFSSTNKDRATLLSGTLKSEGVSTNIVVKEINKVLYYRVRVGPFYSRAEGDKFKDWFVNTGNFDDAFLVVENY